MKNFSKKFQMYLFFLQIFYNKKAGHEISRPAYHYKKIISENYFTSIIFFVSEKLPVSNL